MHEFLTDNVRLAYPLERALQIADKPLWSQLLSDACVATDQELSGGARLSLVSLRRNSTSQLTVTVGATGVPSLSVTIAKGLADFATVYASSAKLKAFLSVNGRVADKIMASSSYGTATESVNIPFAMRCTSSGHKRVTSVSAYSTESCETKRFTGADSPVREISGGDVVIASSDGVDVESTKLMPIEGQLLRVSAIAAPADTSAADTDVDMMVRADECFTVETIPGTKVVGGVPVARTESEPDGLGVMGGGVIRIGNVCKPCCQCEDYKAAADAIRDPASLAVAIEQLLNNAKQQYDEAVAAFDASTERSQALINDLDNVRCNAVAELSPPAYIGSTKSGKRARIAITLSVANMTQRKVRLSGLSFAISDSEFSSTTVSWTRVSGGVTARNTGMPPTVELDPGGTLMVVATYAKTAKANAASRPDTMTASMTLSSGAEMLLKTVQVQ